MSDTCCINSTRISCFTDIYLFPIYYRNHREVKNKREVKKQVEVSKNNRITFFNMTNPSEYSQANMSRTFVQCLIDEFEEEIRCMSGKCIDIGCGPGDTTKDILLPALDPKAVVTGVDILESMITHAKKVYGDEYDHAFTFHVLHWCQDIRQAIENIYHLLRPGGTVLAVTIVSQNLFDILHKLSQDVRYKSHIQHKNYFIPPFYNSLQPQKELKTLLKSIGFNVLHCSHRERTFPARNIRQFASMILSFVTQFLGNMPHERMEQFKDDFTQEYISRFVYKCTCGQNERIASDLHKVLVFYAQKK
ncbi:juvenile hormone acid O-methyltransferase-like isoform X2 [Harpegnathos saltator]|uniref:juvenile hormone acid O-methyltransferase-like isoform X2 n=1 Tax=Harpegnathos saltator TaxID=610380 RepID=UPI000DBED8D3|nr:juvenile hormone acid O-methyltransferase-like isoform X2 [Harpegnathos saltator]